MATNITSAFCNSMTAGALVGGDPAVREKIFSK
jgi:hypothetical protein